MTSLAHLFPPYRLNMMKRPFQVAKKRKLQVNYFDFHNASDILIHSSGTYRHHDNAQSTRE